MTRTVTLLIVSAVVLLALNTPAQVPTAEDKEAEVPAAHVRCWIFPASDKEGATVVAKGADKTEHQLAAATGVAVSPVSYATLPPGAYVLEVKSGDKTVSSSAIQLKDGSYHTIAVVPKGSTWQMTPYFDGPPADQSAPRPVRVFSFAGGRKTILHTGSASPAQVASGSVAELQMPASLVPLRVEVLTTEGGAPAISTVEMDLKQWPSAYVVVSPDYRGRMRPRVLRGGEEPETAEP